jgi:hypothetical protein
MLLMYDIAHWRARAQRVRAIAAVMVEPEPQKLMLKLGAEYDQMAARAECLVAAAERWEHRDSTGGLGYPVRCEHRSLVARSPTELIQQYIVDQ